MIDYLKEYISPFDYENLLTLLERSDIDLLSDNKQNVKEILDYLKSFGIKDFKYILTKRLDLLLSDKNILEEKLSRYDKDLILYIVESDVDNLLNFNI